MAVGGMVQHATLNDAETQFRRCFVRMALEQAGGHRTMAAERLGIGRTMLQRLIKDLGIEVPSARCRNIPPHGESS